MGKLTVRIAFIGILAVIYALLTVSLGNLGYSWLQVRLSEALAPLPFLLGFPALAGVTMGCLIANVISPLGLPDIVFGTSLTLVSCVLSWRASYRKKILACVYPVLINAFGVSSYVSFFYGIPYWLSVATIGAGETISCIIIGYPLLIALERRHLTI